MPTAEDMDEDESDNAEEPEPITADTDDEEVSEESNDESEAMDESSDEALSLVNDPSIIYPWVPTELPSSDDEEDSNDDGPSAVSNDENEPMVFSTTVGHVRSQPARNVARRSRGRCPGVDFFRRGRHRQPVSQQEWCPVRPIDRGITFNGFNRNLEPRRVHGFMHDAASDEILYQVSWRNNRNRGPRPIEASLMRTFSPALVVEFYEELVSRNRLLNLQRR
ncbi:hypothetical protein ACI65C_006400 [Semiaphis heraclei]